MLKQGSSENDGRYNAFIFIFIFMIVQNLRSFLTAVTPTAVAPTVVIFGNKVISHQFKHLGIS